RDRARIYFVAYAAGMALHFIDKAFDEIRAGRTKVFENFDVPDEAIGCGFHEAVRGVLSHHLVIRDGKIANYHPYPPTPSDGRRLGAVRALLALSGEGRAGFADIVAEHDDGTIAAAVAADDMIGQLLLVHGLHPVSLEDRVRAGLDEVRPYLESHGGGVELLGISDGRAALRLHGSCEGCPSSAMTLKLAIESAV